MHRHAVRGLIVISAAAVFTIVAAGCGSSGHNSAPKTSPTAAGSMQATTAACHKIQATLAQAPATLSQLAMHPSTARPQVTAFTTKLRTEAAAAGNPALTSAVGQFASSVQQALASLQSNPGSVASLTTHLTKDSQKITAACSHASG